MQGHILLVSYDEQLLIVRQSLLEQKGYRVSSATCFANAIASCKAEAYDLFILGGSIPRSDKEVLIRAFRIASDAPILSLWTRHEGLTDGVNYLAFTDAPDRLLANVRVIMAKRSSAAHEVANAGQSF